MDLAAEWEVGEAGYESRAENCAFAGRTLRGKVVTTIAAGGIVYRERVLASVWHPRAMLERPPMAPRQRCPMVRL